MAEQSDDPTGIGGPDESFPRYRATSALERSLGRTIGKGRPSGIAEALRLRDRTGPGAPVRRPLPILSLLRSKKQQEKAADAPATKAPQDLVSPIIAPLKLTVVVKKFAKNAAGKTEAYTKPKRQKVTLSTNAAFDGKGTFTRSGDAIKFFKSTDKNDEIKFDGSDNVFEGKKLSSGVTLYAEGAKPSAAPDDVKLTLKLSGGSKKIGPDAVNSATSVEVTLDICSPQVASGADPPPMSTDDKIAKGRAVVEQNKDGTHERALLIIRPVKPAGYRGDLVLKATGVVLKATSGRVAAFVSGAGPGKVDPFTVPTGGVPAAGFKLWAEGVGASDDLRDTGFQLGIKGVEDDGDHVHVTVVKLVLDLCKSRSKKAKKDSDPDPMSGDDRVKVGRFVHEQDTSNHHGRALLVVRAVKPKKFDGTLVLKAVDPATKADPGRTQLLPTERSKPGEAAVASKEFDYTKEKNEDKKFWVQGKTKSATLRDVEYLLFIKGHPESDAEKGVVTVCKFSKLKADIPSTPPNTARAGNAAARHSHEISGAAVAHWDLDDSTNKAVVLIEDSVLAATPINLSVAVEPVGVPVSWSRQRDTRPMKGDHADIAKLSGLPTLNWAVADRLKATMQADAVGSFHIRPYVDCNGSNDFEDGADIEPYLVMNLVLVRVQGKKNESVKGTTALVVPAAPTSATGCRVQSGGWTPATTAAYSKAIVKVIGGGADGRLGLDRVFAGWCQQLAVTPGSASVPAGTDIFARYQHTPPLPAVPVFRREICVFSRTVPAAGGRTFLPADAAPAVDAMPLLDISAPRAAQGTGGDSCAGQSLASVAGGSHTPIAKANKSIGQEWTVDAVDSPSLGLGPAHSGGLAGRMIQFRYNLDFRLDLVLWTNLTGVSGATGDPADRLYASVQTNTWTVRFTINFNPITGAPVGAVPAVALAMNKDAVPTRRAVPVAGLGLETRAPIVLDTYKIDARA